MTSGERGSPPQGRSDDLFDRSPASSQMHFASFDAGQLYQPFNKAVKAVGLFVNDIEHFPTAFAA